MQALLSEPTARYTCSACAEPQVVWGSRPPADAICPDCQRARAAVRSIAEILDEAGVPEEFWTAVDTLRAGKAVPRRAAEWRGEPPMLVLNGPTGDGKSTLAVALLVQLVESGLRPAYVTAARLMLELGEQYDGIRERVLQRYIHADALVVDDLGSEPIRKDTDPALAILADERWSRRRPTIWTTNLPITKPTDAKGRRVDTAASLEDYDGRFVSRILSGEVVKLGPDDLRLGGAQ